MQDKRQKTKDTRQKQKHCQTDELNTHKKIPAICFSIATLHKLHCILFRDCGNLATFLIFLALGICPKAHLLLFLALGIFPRLHFLLFLALDICLKLHLLLFLALTVKQVCLLSFLPRSGEAVS